MMERRGGGGRERERERERERDIKEQNEEKNAQIPKYQNITLHYQHLFLFYLE